MPLVLIAQLLAARRRRDAELAMLRIDGVHGAIAPLMVEGGKKAFEESVRRLKKALSYEGEKDSEAQEASTFEKLLALAQKQNVNRDLHR